MLVLLRSEKTRKEVDGTSQRAVKPQLLLPNLLAKGLSDENLIDYEIKKT